MKLNKIYAGSFVPRTALHLEEFYRFLSQGGSHLKFPVPELQALQKELEVKNPELSPAGDLLTANLAGYGFSYYENGLIISSRQVSNLKKDIELLGDFSLNKLFKSFSYLYKLGAPIPKIFTAIFSVLPFVVTASRLTEKEARKVFSDLGYQIEKEFQTGKEKIYFNSKLILVVGEKENLCLVKDLIFIEDCRGQFNKILNLHRFIWQEVDKIRHRRSLFYKDLPVIRDSLANLNHEVIFLSSRLAQVRSALMAWKSENKEKHFVQDSLSSLEKTGNYLVDLWQMTERQVASTQELLNSLYQENQRKQLNILQIIFIIGAVSEIIMLGSIMGFDFTSYNSTGQLLAYGSSQSFSFSSLSLFGLFSITSSLAIYFVFFWTYNRFSHSRLFKKGDGQSQELRAIKEMFR